MPEEKSDSKLTILLIILSIIILAISAGLYTLTVTGTAGVKLFNVTTPSEQNMLSVSGYASEYVAPDTATMTAGVLTQAATAKEASEKNAASMNAVINAIKNLGIGDKDIRTSYLSIQPVYNYPRDGGTPTITGYSASNNVEVTTGNIEKLSDIVDKSVAAGANQVGGVSFSVSEEKQKQIRERLLSNAAKDAREKADNLARSLNVRITGVRTSSISDTGFPQPFVSGLAEKAATPIQPGESRITISVQVTYLIDNIT
ncbi:MAG: DUF541 domain-containing protein [Candidatus Methanoperedens sp.]|nr:DUF541 domain-containing protein [Candidatus Methanoperedens sp.]